MKSIAALFLAVSSDLSGIEAPFLNCRDVGSMGERCV